jgi:hypothetical protein
MEKMMGVNAANVDKYTKRYALLDPGTYPARLVLIADLGMQAQRPWGDKQKPPAQMLHCTYELTDEFMQDEDGNDDVEKPRWLSESFALHSLNAERAKSTLRYQSLDPQNEHEGDWAQLLGTPCNVSVALNPGKGKNAGKMYENIMGVMPMREKDRSKLPELVNEPRLFDLDEPTIEGFTALPEFVQKKIMGGLGFEDTDFGKQVMKEKAENPPKDEPVASPPDSTEGTGDLDDEIPF